MPTAARFELFDHTADLGIRVTAPSLEELIEPAGRGLYAAIGDLMPGGDIEPRQWSYPPDEPALLLRDYLADLLMLLECEGRLVVSPKVPSFSENGLNVEAPTRMVDESESSFDREVKAITYHDLSIERTKGGYEAVVIVDI